MLNFQFPISFQYFYLLIVVHYKFGSSDFQINKKAGHKQEYDVFMYLHTVFDLIQNCIFKTSLFNPSSG